MTGRPTSPAQLPDPSTQPSSGWHCTHMFYSIDRGILRDLSAAERKHGCGQLDAILRHSEEGVHDPVRMQSYIIAGHKADFGTLLLDPDPLKIDRVHQRIMASELGPALEPTYSFVSFTEISEYVPNPDQYRDRLIAGGEPSDSPALAAKVAAYEKRLPMMNRQRLTPELPDWPSMCFYPMNKSRVVGANWFTTPFSARNSMMAEHAQSGMAFAGRVTQVVTVSVGVDDWEWGVTLWARNPDYLKDIVYKMRFDEASAKYGEFGEFFVGYQAGGKAIAEHCSL
ncbi:MAG TPA: heme-dependent peroxidase [Planctomycetaceae bacterium]|nr:heme-dependent peroxidase [Planctomycetaceae bacterium]